MRLIRSTKLEYSEKTTTDCRCSDLSASARFLYSQERNLISDKNRLLKDDCFRVCSKLKNFSGILDEEKDSYSYSRESNDKQTVKTANEKQIIPEHRLSSGKPPKRLMSSQKPMSSGGISADRNQEFSKSPELSSPEGEHDFQRKHQRN